MSFVHRKKDLYLFCIYIYTVRLESMDRFQDEMALVRVKTDLQQINHISPAAKVSTSVRGTKSWRHGCRRFLLMAKKTFHITRMDNSNYIPRMVRGSL